MVRDVLSPLVFGVAIAAAVVAGPVADAGAPRAAPAAKKVRIRVPKDHATIQAAVDAAPAGATILVSKGTYAEQVVVSDRSGITIVGKGRPVLDAGGAGRTGFTFERCDGVSLSGFTVRNSEIGVWVGDSSSSVVKKCVVVAPRESGVVAAFCERVRFERLSVSDAGDDGVILGYGGPVDDSVVSRCKVVRVGRGGVGIGGSRNLATRNRVTEAANYGVETFRTIVSSESTVSRNAAKRCGVGFRVHGIGNTFSRNVSVGAATVGVDVADDADDCVVEGHKLKKSGDDGIFVEGVDTSIRSCSISRSGGDGIEIAAKGVRIERTKVTKSGGFDLNDPAGEATLGEGNRIGTTNP